MKKSLSVSILVLTAFVLSSCRSGTELPSSWNNTDQKASLSRAEQLTPEEVQSILANSWFTLSKSNVTDISNHLRADNSWNNIQNYINSLTGSDINSKMNRSYLQSFMGDYQNANRTRDELCSYNPATCPQSDIELKINTPLDAKTGEAIGKTNIYVNARKIDTSTKPKFYNNMVHRIRVEKEWYLDTYGLLNAIPGGYNKLDADPKMKKAELHTSTPASQSTKQKVTNFEYSVPANAFTDMAGNPVTGNVDIYYFSLDQWDQGLSVFQLSTFYADGTLAGHSMFTFGMPIVTAYQNGLPLKIRSPIEWSGAILGVTPEMDLQNVPKNVWLWAKELLKYKIPPFWSLNREAGIWTESKMMILDTKGTYRFQISR